MKYRILVTGEGPDDYGYRDYQTQQWIWGPVYSYLIACAERFHCTVELEVAERQDVERKKLQGRSLKGLEGKEIPARRFYLCMRDREVPYGIYYCDVDRESGAKNSDTERKRCFESVYQAVKRGGNPEGEEEYKVIPMVALRMIEAWLLADEDAFKKVFGRTAQKVDLPPRPETLWGAKEKAESNYPKNYMERVLSIVAKGSRGRNREWYFRIAEETDLDILRVKCSVSFGRFYEEIKDVFQGKKE